MRERMTKIRKVFHPVWQTHWIKVKNCKHQTVSRSFGVIFMSRAPCCAARLADQIGHVRMIVVAERL